MDYFYVNCRSIKIYIGKNKMKLNLCFGLLTLLLFTSSCTSINDCGYNVTCFSNLAKNCQPSSLNIAPEGNIYRITVRGMDSHGCEVSYKIDQVSKAYRDENPALSEVIQEKAVTCHFSLSEVENGNITYFELIKNFNDSINENCNGPLKDIFLEPANEELMHQMTRAFQ